MATRTLTAAAILVTFAGNAVGQNALGTGGVVNPVQGDRARNSIGDGRGLDLNPLIGGGGKNGQVRDFQAEMQFRNSIVTGNAPNGLSFRGDLPYSAPGEFQGYAGSNDLYSYRRDTLSSGLAGMGIRGTEALQQQFALTTGNRLPDLLSGSLTVNRFGSGDPNFANTIKNSLPSPNFTSGIAPGTAMKSDPALLEPDFSSSSLDTGQELGTLRSTSAYTSTRGVQPTLLDVRTTPNQDLIGVSASTLRGIQSIPLGKASQDNSVAGVKNALNAGANGTPGSGNTPGGVPSNPIGSSTALTQEAIGNTAYNDLMGRLNQYSGATSTGEAPATDTRPTWQKQLDTLRSSLSASDMGAAPASAAPGSDAPAGPLPSEGGAVPIEPVKGAEPVFVPSAVQPLPPVKNYIFDPATVDTLRNASGQINSLVPLSDTSGSSYADHMQIAQSELAKGRYFDAEEEFTRAIAAKPNDAMALIGRVHAQLGAGTNLSAWMNLRELFKTHPELLGTKYSANLLPDPDRMQEIVASLRTLISKGGALHREASMLLAYVGYQSGDDKVLAEGLAAMDKAKENQSDALTDLITAVWSGKTPPPDAGTVLPASPLPSEPPEPEK